LNKKRFKLNSPAIWSSIPEIKEPTYDEVVIIKKGVGYCNSESAAKRLQKFGYTVTDLQK